MKHIFKNTLRRSVPFALILAAAVWGCKKEQAKSITATVTYVLGDVKVVKEATESKATVGFQVSENDKIVTGDNSAAIIKFDDGSASVELQSNTEFDIKSYTETHKELFLAKGNAWVNVERLQGSSDFTLHTPTSVAGVRGTKFYTFNMGDISGTCFCEGTVDYESKSSHFHQKNPEDYIVFTKGDKTVIVTQQELKEAGIADPKHNHSVIADSPLGKQYDLSKEEQKIFFGLVEKKLQAESLKK